MITETIPVEINEQQPTLTEKDLAEIISYEGIIGEVFGSEGQLKVLSTHAQIFFEKFDEIKQLPSFNHLIDRAMDEHIENPETYVIKATLIQLGIRANAITANLNKVVPSINSKLVYEEISCDDAIFTFANKLATLAEGGIWELEDPGSIEIYNSVTKRVQEIRRQHTTTFHESAIEKRRSPNPTENIEIKSESEAELVAEVLAPDIENYTEGLKSDREGKKSQFERAASLQEGVATFVKKIFQPVEVHNKDEAIKNLPEVVILGGVGHSEHMWQERIRYYESHDVKVKYIPWPEFTEEDTFESQANWLYEQLKNDDGQMYSFEAHSRGGLALWHLMKNHPEVVDHAIVTCSPTKSNEDAYPTLVSAGLRWCLDHVEEANRIIEKIPALSYFKELGNWQEAFRIYKSLIGEQDNAQWDEVISSTSWTIPKYLQYGGNDIMVNIVGMSSARKALGAVFNMVKGGEHNVVGNHKSALDIHLRLSAEAKRRSASIVEVGN